MAKLRVGERLTDFDGPLNSCYWDLLGKVTVAFLELTHVSKLDFKEGLRSSFRRCIVSGLAVIS